MLIERMKVKVLKLRGLKEINQPFFPLCNNGSHGCNFKRKWSK